MKNIGKKAFLFRIIGFVVFVIFIVVMVFLIRNEWDILAALIDFIDFLAKLKDQTSS